MRRGNRASDLSVNESPKDTGIKRRIYYISSFQNDILQVHHFPIDITIIYLVTLPPMSSMMNKSTEIVNIGSYSEYKKYISDNKDILCERSRIEKDIYDKAKDRYNGFCYACNKPRYFVIDFKTIVDKGFLNWREQLYCPYCELNNRMRAAYFLIRETLKPADNQTCYITEQISPLYFLLKKQIRNLTGSEHLGSKYSFGNSYWLYRRWTHLYRIRNETLESLSFRESTFDYIFSFDVFEHIQNYQSSFMECFRCLKSGGILFFSVPFTLDSNADRLLEISWMEGKSESSQLEYHANPLSKQKCLCYHHFGWDLLSELERIGFQDVRATFLWSTVYAHLGQGVVFIFAVRPI